MGFWVPFLISIALQTVAYLLIAKPQKSHIASAEKLEVPTAQEGSSIMWIFGTPEIDAANVAWFGDVDSEAIKSKSGKK